MATAQRRIRTASASARAAAPAPAQAPRRTGIREETGRGHVSTSTAHRREVYDETSQEIEVVKTQFAADEHPSFVRVGGGMTINLGDFNMLRIDCSVTIPCRGNEIDDAYEIATDFVAEKLDQEQVRWLGNGNQRKAKR